MKLLDPIQIYEGDGKNPYWKEFLHGEGPLDPGGDGTFDHSRYGNGSADSFGSGFLATTLFANGSGYGDGFSGSEGDGTGTGYTEAEYNNTKSILDKS